jgi:outer membrane protein OmpA-like peptidoglycan-associated protein
MKYRSVLVAITMFVLATIPIFAKNGAPGTTVDNPFWADYWGKPRVVLFGPQEQAFNDNVHEVAFAHDRFDHALDQDTLNANVQWLKDHDGVRFYVEGYASATGSELYNLNLSSQRAEWIKHELIEKGIVADRIVLGVPWGMMYPACTENTEECHAKNRVVRFTYAP